VLSAAAIERMGLSCSNALVHLHNTAIIKLYLG